MKFPLVSLVILNWNGKKYLESCLKSLSKMTYKPLEIIVVDQNSSDGSQELVKKKFPKVVLIENKENTGYVGGNNTGVAKAKGKYAMILNNDIEVDKNFLEPLIEEMEKDKTIGCVQPRAVNLRYKNKLDGAGSFFTSTGFLNHVGYLKSKNEKQFNKPYPVYGVKGAYMLFRRDLYMKFGGLDKDFFIYFEETDFCARLWLAGYKVMYLPLSTVYHWGGTDTRNDWKKRFALVQFRAYKNRMCSYVKNLSVSTLITLLPIHLFLCEGLSLYHLFTGDWRVTISIQNALLWNILQLPNTLKKRKHIQKKIRKVSDSEIFALTKKDENIFYYLRILFLLKEE